MKENEVAERIRTVRRALNLSRPGIAEKLGCSPMSWKAYEQGASWPGGKILSNLRSLGVSIDWLLTGQGQMFAPPVGDTFPGHAGPVNEALLRDVIEAVEQVLGDIRRSMPPAKKALLLTELYMMILEENMESATKRDLVRRMVRLAS